MNQDVREAQILHDLLFSICGVGSMNSTDGSIDVSPLEGRHGIIAFTEGRGSLLIDGITVPIKQGVCLIAHAETKLVFDTREGDDLTGLWVTFSMHCLGTNRPLPIHPHVPFGYPITPTPFIKCVDLLEQIVHKGEDGGPFESYKQQIRLQELLLLMLESHQAKRAATDSIQAVEQSVAYLEEHFIEHITVEQLVQHSGVRRWEYSSIFQAITGYKPLDYLTEVRMKRAKELLLLSNAPLRDIAHRVGFKDEYYFNRRFRQSMGISPKQYARTHPRNVMIQKELGSQIELPLQNSRIVVIGYALGNLLTLGVRPVGADLTVIGKQVVYRNELQHIMDIGPREDLERIKALAPDFIFYCNTVETAATPISQIAPTLVLDREDANFEQLRLMAAVLGKRPHAEKWIKNYKSKSKALWNQYRLDIKANETVTVIVIVDGRLYVMGNHGLSFTLHHPLAFKPSEKVRAMMEMGVEYQEISAEMIAAYAGDRLFLLVGEDQISLDSAKLLIISPLWRELAPVQNNLVYLMDAKWNYDDSITLERLLNVLPDVLRKSV
ncbi:helix-turn-helix domain-containing protein [Paenibacillus sp. HWE-109]|uniref:helix-turn-helix domain-containing protein n=1 Tax=Paenibacillus sp. HWE-109 TaxID=1306526 RepID=UPI001EE0ABDD|nr:helix-turn-helix domain-containing protein [Paenibacillus sp. HWE-109]UKS29326.1 helix-turn-helix domain-containing protein [Paenibacillus sp. HWE-109]